ncbi:Crp/Fnr family transcriptional regulator [Flavobacterium aurantiibacter]|uniref:Crp/Fnr family transcriptional regulator n=1 Tax=Flavobacterium aurantiibacter TaxID=2023067 RepID=UPI001A9C57E4|nr:Crp/Fnr family transcriptional regulator [Flavobacterium aurantiibacter]
MQQLDHLTTPNFEIILANVNKHIHLDRTEVDYFLSLLQYKTFKKKEFILRPSEICRTENFIIRGCTKTYTLNELGAEHIVMFGVEDWWIGDLYSFLSQTPSTYYIEALEESEILQISKSDLDTLYARVPKFERFFRILLQNAFIAQQKRIEQTLALTAEERYLDFVQKYPSLEQRLSQKQVATYLRITPVFLSMLRKRLTQR